MCCRNKRQRRNTCRSPPKPPASPPSAYAAAPPPPPAQRLPEAPPSYESATTDPVDHLHPQPTAPLDLADLHTKLALHRDPKPNNRALALVVRILSPAAYAGVASTGAGLDFSRPRASGSRLSEASRSQSSIVTLASLESAPSDVRKGEAKYLARVERAARRASKAEEKAWRRWGRAGGA